MDKESGLKVRLAGVEMNKKLYTVLGDLGVGELCTRDGEECGYKARISAKTLEGLSDSLVQLCYGRL